MTDTATPRRTKPITCYCEDFEYDRDDLAPDGMCVCGHVRDEHTHEGDNEPCANTETFPRQGWRNL